MKLFRQEEIIPSEAIRAFWKWFGAHAAKFKIVLERNENVEDELFNPLSTAFQAFKADIFFLLGHRNNETAELIITADGNVKNFYLIDAIVAEAPTISGWQITAHKKPLDLDALAIKIGQLLFDKNTLYFVPVMHEHYPDLIDINIVYTAYDPKELTSIQQGVFLFLDNYLGELKFVQSIDQIKIIATPEDKSQMIPIEKLVDYINWRETEFVEKYTSSQSYQLHEAYNVLTATLENNQQLVAIINTALLEWDAKASHPWIGIFSITFNANTPNGFPDDAMHTQLEQIEHNICLQLKEKQGVLYLGRQTLNSTRELFFTAKDYVYISKIFYAAKNHFEPQFEIHTDIFKDKYWVTFDKYRVAEES